MLAVSTQPSDPLPLVLGRLRNVKSSGDNYTARCPAHDDQHNSLSVGVGDDGRVLLNCHTGCETEDVVRAAGLQMADLFPRSDAKLKGVVGTSIPHRKGSTVQHPTDSEVLPGKSGAGPGCTLQEYAEAKRLPPDFLRRLGLSEITYQGSPAIRIPYFVEGGQEARIRFRTGLHKADDADNRFRWKSGDKAMPYGLWKLEGARKAGHIAIVEGESDCHTLWLHELPALGLPGADTWKDEYAGHLEGIPVIYAVIEPDRGGQTLHKALSASPIRDRLRLIDLGTAKDPSGLYLAEPALFANKWRAALDAATLWAEAVRSESAEKAAESWALCEELAKEPDILGRFAGVLARRGLAGEVRVAKLLYLVLTSRFLPRPVSAAVKGPSSAGKSHAIEKVLDFFPADAYYALSAMSERALAYSEEPLRHRIMIIYEAAGLTGDFASYLMRSLLSEGRVRYETVEKTGAGLRPRLIEREGPTGLLVTTTAVHLHPENETRLLSIPVTDTPHQTRAIFRALADETTRREPDPAQDAELQEWRALQEWLAGAEHDVTIPYAMALADLVPPVAVRLRRDFPMVLNLIRAHAILHQATRSRDASGQIVAGLEDYAAIRALVADLVSEGVEATVPATIRETVRAVAELSGSQAAGVLPGLGLNGTAAPGSASVSQVATFLQIDKGAASRRVKVCLDRGYLTNLEQGRGKPYKLQVGEPLPEDQEILPHPDRLAVAAGECCTVDGQTEGIKTPLAPTDIRAYRCPMKPGTVCTDCPDRCSYSLLYDKYEQEEQQQGASHDHMDCR